MPSQNIHVVQEIGTLEDLYEEVAKLQKTLKYLINGNLDFENLRARSIKADNIEAGTLTAEEIAANTITAEKMDVTELSAITANMGKITSGEMYSAYISTSESGYPRVTIDPTGNYIGVYTSATAYMEIKPGITGAPALTVYEGGDLIYALGTSFGLPFLAGTNSMAVRAGSSLTLDCGDGVLDDINVPSWDKFRSISDAQTLADALNNLATAITDKATAGVSTGSGGSATLNGGIAPGTQLSVVGGGSVTWAGISIPSHTHTQQS